MLSLLFYNSKHCHVRLYQVNIIIVNMNSFNWLYA